MGIFRGTSNKVLTDKKDGSQAVFFYFCTQLHRYEKDDCFSGVVHFSLGGVPLFCLWGEQLWKVANFDREGK